MTGPVQSMSQDHDRMSAHARMSARTSGRAPLAVRESFESKIEDFTELRDFQGYEKPMDLKLKPENVTQQEFYYMSRKQQNLKMYKVPDMFY